MWWTWGQEHRSALPRSQSPTSSLSWDQEAVPVVGSEVTFSGEAAAAVLFSFYLVQGDISEVETAPLLMLTMGFVQVLAEVVKEGRTGSEKQLKWVAQASSLTRRLGLGRFLLMPPVLLLFLVGGLLSSSSH